MGRLWHLSRAGAYTGRRGDRPRSGAGEQGEPRGGQRRRAEDGEAAGRERGGGQCGNRDDEGEDGLDALADEEDGAGGGQRPKAHGSATGSGGGYGAVYRSRCGETVRTAGLRAAGLSWRKPIDEGWPGIGSRSVASIPLVIGSAGEYAWSLSCGLRWVEHQRLAGLPPAPVASALRRLSESVSRRYYRAVEDRQRFGYMRYSR